MNINACRCKYIYKKHAGTFLEHTIAISESQLFAYDGSPATPKYHQSQHCIFTEFADC